ncbi:MAG: ABC transporter permease [Cellvibrio sp. 79]|nr:MAG: ABC transporter permease [Cellvibrio sp. 79]
MNKFLKASLCTALVMCLPLSAQAHRAWLLPSATVLSSDDAWVSVDAAVSNDIFHADHAPMGVDGITITAPDGTSLTPQNSITGKFRSVFDVQLPQKGTYKIALASSGIMATWKTPEGERRMWPGRGEKANPADLEKNIPKDAKELQVSQFSRRMETFVTSGTPDDKVLKATKQGLELVPITHPNDLFAGEAAKFQFLIDGKPAEGVKVTVIPAGMRYRNSQAAIEVQTDKKGELSVTWPQAGMYWLSANYRDDKAKKPATSRSGSYAATFEVLPE